MPGGRPKYEPTPADRATVKAMVCLGASEDVIARCVGEYGVTPKTLRKHFRKELDQALWELKRGAIGGLVQAVNKGERWAIEFTLRSKGGYAPLSAYRIVDKEDRDRGLQLADIDAAIAEAENTVQQ